MPYRQILRRLKALDVNSLNISLAVVKEYKKEGVSTYNISYVKINERLEKKLKTIVQNKITNSNTTEEYTYDCAEPSDDLVRSINYSETDFYSIYSKLIPLNPEEDIITEVEELEKAKAYLIILRNTDGIQIIGFKTVPENWKMKRKKGFISLLFTENRFEDLEQGNVFSISNTIDLIYFNEILFILSKKEFEKGLNFRKGMLSRANEFYEEVEGSNIFVNLDILKEKVGNNQRYLRKIATIKNLGHYQRPEFLTKMQELSLQKGWNLQFEDNKIVFTEETLDAILTLLQNKRLYSELTEQNFDVESAKPLQQ